MRLPRRRLSESERFWDSGPSNRRGRELLHVGIPEEFRKCAYCENNARSNSHQVGISGILKGRGEIIVKFVFRAISEVRLLR